MNAGLQSHGWSPAEVDRIARAATLLVFALGLIVCLRPVVLPSPEFRSRCAAARALVARRPTAAALAAKHHEQYPHDVAGLALAAEAAARQSHHELSMQLYGELPRDGGVWEFQAELGLAKRLQILGDAAQAERHLRRALEINPLSIEANNRLGHLLQVAGRVWESAPHFFVQILQGKCRGDELLGMSATDRFFRTDERLQQMGLARDEPDPLILIAEARRALFENRTADAERLLREVVAARPDLGEAQGRLGRIIVDRGDLREFLEWRGRLADAARAHPEVWYVQGLQARRLGQTEGAARCFLEALALSPNHLGANTQVAGCLEQLNRPEAAGRFSERATRLAELETALNLLRSDLNLDILRQTIANFGAMGRYWEAGGWAYVMTHIDGPPDVPRDAMRRWLPIAVRSPSANVPELLPARDVRLDDFAPPRWPLLPAASSVPSAAGPALEPGRSAWRMEDEAALRGIDFTYFEGTTEEDRLQHIFNVMGGGLGVLDYDLDGWPDLSLAQANDWRNPAPQPQYVDPLYRNVAGRHFVNVTGAARVGDPDFSHGVTVGDFDQDGFPDFYVGNLGENRLYHNRGDGTFADVTESAGVAGDAEDWTTSSVFADFNDDGLPDLYVLNYTLVTPTREKECTGRGGRTAACTPDVLPAGDDRCYVNAGDGTFRDVSAAAGILAPNGRGLGVVVWPYGTDRRLGIFVANDTTANFLFMNQGPAPDGTPRFRDEAIVRGVAYDGDGNAQASMGVAAGDVNGDGRIELFITNFFADSNILYSQDRDGFFLDLTRLCQLRDASFWTLGFGCQFADINGDSWPDIVLTNGHVDQTSSRGDPDRMRPQLFENVQGRGFREVTAEESGPFFSGRYLGRGLAILDWNGDGCPDAAISHLHAPLALLTNHVDRSAGHSRRLVLRLAGRTGGREPVGASVTVRAGASEFTSLQTAGGGFLTSNDPRHQFALPTNVRVASARVTWPGGHSQIYEGLQVGTEYVLPERWSQGLRVRTLRTPE